jgi:hypothetical protein
MSLIWDYLTAKHRPLTQEEKDDATRVYLKTINYSLVIVADDLGFDNRKWTEPAGNGGFVLHLGPMGYASTADSEMRATLIHELCHVWQGMNHLISWGYVADSAIQQGLCKLAGCSAYAYKPGDLWGEYNVEQQAHIVEDWYRGGLRTDSPLFTYIAGNIRCPILSWFGETATEIGAGAAAIKG